jgi:hypothetical protein
MNDHTGPKGCPMLLRPKSCRARFAATVIMAGPVMAAPRGDKNGDGFVTDQEDQARKAAAGR